MPAPQVLEERDRIRRILDGVDAVWRVGQVRDQPPHRAAETLLPLARDNRPQYYQWVGQVQID